MTTPTSTANNSAAQLVARDVQRYESTPVDYQQVQSNVVSHAQEALAFFRQD